MKKILLICTFSLLLIPFSQAQEPTCDCKGDLEYLTKKVKKIPSFKRNKDAYLKKYAEVSGEVSSSTPYFECFERIQQLLLTLKDWHMGVYETYPKDSMLVTVAYPRYSGSLTELEEQLSSKSSSDIEGVYYRKGRYRFGLVYNHEESIYNGVLFESQSPRWKAGDIFLQLRPQEGKAFSMLWGQYPSTRAVTTYTKIQEGLFLSWGFVKDTLATYYNRTPYPKRQYVYKSLNDQVDYIKVGSFKSFYPTLKEAEDFYRSIQGKLNKKHLILDLRDNGGGGDRNSDILLEQLLAYLKQGQLHIITNAVTGSNAEQFTVKLKKMANVISYGGTTLGALAYEKKGKVTHTLPSTGFLVTLPTKVHKEFLPFETRGVSPDVPLELGSSWIQQIVDRILSKE
jgi:hypothetical protein